MAEKCGACGGRGTPGGGLAFDCCRSCHGTGVEPVATDMPEECAECGHRTTCAGDLERCRLAAESDPLTCCYRDTCAEARANGSTPCPEVALRSRLSAVLAAGEGLVYLVEHVAGLAGTDWWRRREKALAAWKAVRDA